jgi:hypothetical protein
MNLFGGFRFLPGVEFTGETLSGWLGNIKSVLSMQELSD